MTGSSNWFQVHDKHPFGIMKKEMANIRDREVPCPPLKQAQGRPYRLEFSMRQRRSHSGCMMD